MRCQRRFVLLNPGQCLVCEQTKERQRLSSSWPPNPTEAQVAQQKQIATGDVGLQLDPCERFKLVGNILRNIPTDQFQAHYREYQQIREDHQNQIAAQQRDNQEEHLRELAKQQAQQASVGHDWLTKQEEERQRRIAERQAQRQQTKSDGGQYPLVILQQRQQQDQIVTEGGAEADESKTSGYYEDTRLSMSLQNILSADPLEVLISPIHPPLPGPIHSTPQNPVRT